MDTNLTIADTPTVSPTASPTTSPPTATPTKSLCADTSLEFHVVANGIVSETDCDWVRKKPNLRCTIPDVAAACPVTCNACEICSDPIKLKFSMMFGFRKEVKGCNFVGRVPEMIRERCEASDNICRETCGYCSSRSPSIAPSKTPSLPPIKSPSLFPSIVPTLSLTPTLSPTIYNCTDSAIRFQFYEDGIPRIVNCDWVKNTPNLRCTIPGVAAACPVTCNTCNVCVDPIQIKIPVQLGQNKRMRACDYVRRYPWKVQTRCEESRYFCRATCGMCSVTDTPTIAPIAPTALPSVLPSATSSVTPTVTPTVAPTASKCADTTLQFLADLDLDGRHKVTDCKWVVINPKLRCSIPGIAEACPITCSACDRCNDPDVLFPFPITSADNDIKVKGCDYIGRISELVQTRCEVSDNICRATCGMCSSSQTYVDDDVIGESENDEPINIIITSPPTAFPSILPTLLPTPSPTKIIFSLYD